MINKLKITYIIIMLSVLSVNLAGCGHKDEDKKTSSEINGTKHTHQTADEENYFRIAVGSMITPKEGYAYYKKLLNYIADKAGRRVKFVDRETYAEINELLKTNKVDLAFVCGGPYVEGHDEFGLELLVAPCVNGESVYYSYIIVPVDSEVNDFESLRGKTFAFAEPNSNSGKLVPAYMLAEIDETPESFFKQYSYTYAHDKSIRAVANKLVDGAAVDSLIWEYMKKHNPEITSKAKIIKKSQPFGIPPVVVPKGLKPETKKLFREILLNIHKDEKGREILRGMGIEKFTAIDDRQYESIRKMKTFVLQKTSNKK